jgi:biopolymer transport protein ExbD
MARKRRRHHLQAGELNLTAMIDVAFQLLSFFIIATHPVDVFTNLNVFRPEPNTQPPPKIDVEDLLEVMVYKDGFVMQRRKVTIEEVERQLKLVASTSKEVSLIVKCTKDSTHGNLVRVLDTSAKVGLTKISVFSL